MAAYIAPSHGGDPSLVDDLEASFQALFSALVGQDNVNIVDQDEVKTGVEQAAQKFIDVSKEIEAFFLQKRLLLETQRPEQVIKESTDDLRAELSRKENLIHRLQGRVQQWQEMLGTFQSGQVPVPSRVKQDTTPVSTAIGAVSTATAAVAAQQSQQMAHQQQQSQTLPQAQRPPNVGTPPVGTPTGHPSSAMYMGPLAQLEQAASQVSSSFERR